MNRHDAEFEIQRIRNQYTEKKSTELDSLKELDKKVKLPANIFAYVFGSVGALILGSGMSLAMTDLGAVLGISAAMPAGIVIGAVGIVISAVTYPIFKKILEKRRKKYASEILALSEKMLKENGEG